MNETLEHQSDMAEAAIAQAEDTPAIDANAPFANLDKNLNQLASDEVQNDGELKIEGELKDLLSKGDIKTLTDKYSSVLDKIVVSKDKMVTLKMKLAIVEHIGDNLRYIRDDQVAREALKQAQYIAEHGEGHPREIAQALVDFFGKTVK